MTCSDGAGGAYDWGEGQQASQEWETLMLLRTSIAAVLFLHVSVPCYAGSPALGAFVGNSPSDLRQFEHWLGRPVDQITAHTGRANWKDWVDSIRWSVKLWSPLN